MAAGLREAGDRREDPGDRCAGRLDSAIAEGSLDEGVGCLAVEAFVDLIVRFRDRPGQDRAGRLEMAPADNVVFIDPDQPPTWLR